MSKTNKELVAENTELKGIIADQKLFLQEKDRFLSEHKENYNALMQCFERLSNENTSLGKKILNLELDSEESRYEIDMLRADVIFRIEIIKHYIKASSEEEKLIVTGKYRRHYR